MASTPQAGHAHHHHTHRLARLPPWLTRWLGYRSSPPPTRSRYIIWLWSFIGAFCGISLIQAVFGHAQYFIRRGVPSIVASYVSMNSVFTLTILTLHIAKGASAVLIYGTIDAPLAQPRALFGGHFIGALTGICITKLFHLLPTEEKFQDLLWLAGSLSCALSVVLMQATSTTHPPAGSPTFRSVIGNKPLNQYFCSVSDRCYGLTRRLEH